ncbi:MAG: hypothetical protein WBS54_09495 [Acidobacteriota bacterium]
MLQLSDSRRRFVMPKEAPIGPNSPAEVSVLPDGRVLITPLRTIPINEEWALTPESREQTAQALKDHQAGRSVTGLKALDAKIQERRRRK